MMGAHGVRRIALSPVWAATPPECEQTGRVIAHCGVRFGLADICHIDGARQIFRSPTNASDSMWCAVLHKLQL